MFDKISFIEVSYYISSFFFILALGGLSNQETSRKGNFFGIFGTILAIIATFFEHGFEDYVFLKFFIVLVTGGLLGTIIAIRVQMISMPEMVAVLHSFVGIAATIVGFANFQKEDTQTSNLQKIETSLGIFIGAITFTGSVVAFLKLQGTIGSKPLILGGYFRHIINGSIIIASITLIVLYCLEDSHIQKLIYISVICALALFLGFHLVMAIGGADMPVVVSMLNSYSGWATSASGFMLQNHLLIVAGALIGSSGAILSYIMCKAMNRSFLSVIMGGFGMGTESKQEAMVGEMKEALVDEVVQDLMEAKSIIIVPGYGMAVSRAQNSVGMLAANLKKLGKKCRFCIHPVAGRLPGHMNVLLAEAKVPYDIVVEMDHINEDFEKTDVVIVIGANDIVNPDAIENPNSPIKGMPVCEVWKARKVYINKRGKGKGYAAIENPLFFKDNSRMFYGNAEDKIQEILRLLSEKAGISKVQAKEAKIEIEIQDQPILYKKIAPPQNPDHIIGVPKEVEENEKRVAISPDIVRKLTEKGFLVKVESGAGVNAGFSDEIFEFNGAVIVDTQEIFENSEIIVKIKPPQYNVSLGKDEAETFNNTKLLICYVYPAQNKEIIEKLCQNSNKELRVLAHDCIPRITRGQKMDTLSSMTNLAGYRAVIEAFNHFPKFSKSQITAAGKVPPAKLFVIGAGVAGLAALGVAGGLGCELRAFDTRAAAVEQLESLGAKAVSMNFEEKGEGSGGYGKEMSEEYYKAQREMIMKQAQEVDIIVTTALIPGKAAPILITKEHVRAMKNGSVIVDMAAERGGNCELTKQGEIIVDEVSGVTIIGLYDYPSKMAQQASELFGKNMFNLFEELIGLQANKSNTAKNFTIDDSDEIIQGMTIIKNGEFVWKQPQQIVLSQAQKPQQIVKQESKILNTKDLEQKLIENDDVVIQTPFCQQPLIQAVIVVTVFVGIGILISQITDSAFVNNMGIFILAIFLGYLVVWSVTPSLHTPLMAVTNAISGIIIVGLMDTLIPRMKQDPFFQDYSILAFIGIFFASINIFGGFIVTYRMLKMFHKQ